VRSKVMFKKANFIQSRAFITRLVTERFESVHQHVAYITEQDEAFS
jgi:hypothetical protein